MAGTATKPKRTKKEEAVAMGAAIRARRDNLRIPRDDFGPMVGLRPEQIRKIEAGESYCSMDSLFNIANALKCSPSELVSAADAIVKTKPLSGVAQLAARLTVNQYPELVAA